MAATSTSEQGHFPTIDDVLSELKSNGTFDKFRKSCLASVQAEPSFRAYGEHIEVVSRRYLQNFKWRESTTKNQVRSRLKDHALRVIESPDIQVGVPFSALVEKSMETQGKELLPKIMEVVKGLQAAKPNHAQVSQHATGDERKLTEGDAHRTGLEFDLSLPIDLPGLMPTVKKDPLSNKKELTVSESAGKSSRNKPKFTDVLSKGGGNSKLKGNGRSSTEGKDVKKEKDVAHKSPLVLDEKKYFKAKPLKPVKVNKEENKTSVHIKQNEMAPVTETLGRHNDSKEPTKATTNDSCINEPVEKSEQMKLCHNVSTQELVEESSSKLGNERKTNNVVGKYEEKPPETAELNIEEQNITTEVNEDKKHTKETLGDDESEVFRVEADPVYEDNGDEERKKDMLPPRRRSARIASLSDDQKLETDSNQGDIIERKTNRRNPDRCSHKVNKTKFQSYRSRKGGNSRRKGKAYLNSSSDESEVERSVPSERIGIEEISERYASKRPGHRKRDRNFDQDDRGDYSRKRQKTVSRTASPASTGSSASSSVMLQEGPSSGRHHKSKGQRSSSSHRVSSRSPTPAVVTRFNRHVKPNRRYYDSDEDRAMEEGGDSGMEEQTAKTRKFSRWAK